MRELWRSLKHEQKRGRMNREPNQAEGKKLYEIPRVTTISLRPEEAVLGHCKTATGKDACNTPCASFLCQNVGS
jgi:hypothetical protein